MRRNHVPSGTGFNDMGRVSFSEQSSTLKIEPNILMTIFPCRKERCRLEYVMKWLLLLFVDRYNKEVIEKVLDECLVLLSL